MNVFLASGLEDLKNAIRWTKTVPGFNDLSWDDKICLIRASWMDLILLRLSYRSINEPKGSTVFGKRLVMKHCEVKKMGWSQGMMDDHDEFTDKLRMLSPDRNEFACLCALVLLTSGMNDPLFTVYTIHRIGPLGPVLAFFRSDSTPSEFLLKMLRNLPTSMLSILATNFWQLSSHF